MPNFDGGHYFLTVLAPIESRKLYDHHGMKSAAVHLVREVLATLPTALQSSATEEIGLNSPFARTRRTHLARFAVIEDLVYNGRNRRDAVQVAALGPNPVIADVEDKLNCPYLLFIADFDARSGDPEELRVYLAELWSTMEAELHLVFGHCIGFDQVTNAVSFQDYIFRCQVETTMPFNDYWMTPPPLTSLKTQLIGTVVALAAIALLGFGILVASGSSMMWAGFLAVVGFLAALVVPYAMVMAHGRQPFPTAPNSDLPSVLKALYLQQKFTPLAVAAQGQNDQTLYDLFGKFVAEHKPTELRTPTQDPGVVRS